jgi:hypothetical protein
MLFPVRSTFFCANFQPPENHLSLEIEYSVMYESRSAMGCQLSQILTAVVVSGEPPGIEPQIHCVTLGQEALHLSLKCAALATVIFMIAVLFQRLGYWNFCEWMKMPNGGPIVKPAHGIVAVEASAVALFGSSFIDAVDSESSEVSEPLP